MTVLKTWSAAASPLPAASTPDSSLRKRKANAADPFMENVQLAPVDQQAANNDHTAAPSKKPKVAKQQPNAVRSRRKSRWKLKFHHQALPPEYLKHYRQQEKKRRLTESKKLLAEKEVSNNPASRTGEDGSAEASGREVREDSSSPTGISQNIPGTATGHRAENFTQHPAMFSYGDPRLDPRWPGLLTESFPNLNIDLSQNKAFIENLLTNQIEINRVDRSGTRPPSVPLPALLPKPTRQKKPKAIPSSGKIMNYSDLPYMGEITLDGVKPRRGRKPKKADICHLIYKNYGQVFPGSPGHLMLEAGFTKNAVAGVGPPPVMAPPRSMSIPQAESPLPTVSGLLNHSEVQNRIINSLLERRLTQKNREKCQNTLKSNETNEEPLNLCVKDLQSLKIKLSRKHGNIYEAKTPQEDVLHVKKEVVDVESDESSADDGDITPFNLVSAELRESDDDDNVSLGGLSTPFSVGGTEAECDQPILPPDPTMFWPPSNYFYSPMPIVPDIFYPNQSFTKEPAPEKKLPKPIKGKSQSKRLIAKPQNSTSSSLTKRKRSAIFIPPLPAENTTNPATEVSICKFKFTGGAKPSLQEKKMLSVDSGGNFRYYSGTGDKSMRGYEYFPRESLQQCQDNTGCSPSGVFLTASALGSGEKIPEEIGHSDFFDPTFPLQLTPKSESSRRDKKRKANTSYPGDNQDSDDESDSEMSNGAPSPLENSSLDVADPERRLARRSRKTLAREKLEQTFKEKGFLIQTQQHESAEGATYCKFRQLRKFTRYLFRSWKDYLPGNVRDLNETSAAAAEAAVTGMRESQQVENLPHIDFKPEPVDT